MTENKLTKWQQSSLALNKSRQLMSVTDSVLAKSKPEDWMLELWRWADEAEIDEEYLPREKQKLIELTELDLYSLDATEINPGLGNLTRLKHLKLNFRKAPELPDVLANLKNLRSLEINPLIDEDDLNNLITNLITKLPQLKSLLLGCQNLETFPLELTQLRELTSLELHSSFFEKIPDAISKLERLEHLLFECRYLKEFPNEILQLHNLESLELYQVEFTHFPTEVEELSKLKHLMVENYKKEVIPSGIAHFNNLESLEISSPIKEFPIELNRLIHLRTLYLYCESLDTLPSSIEALIELENLTLLDASFDELPYFPSLSTLTLVRPKSNLILSDISKYTRLTWLTIRHYNLDYLPQDIIKLTQLKTIKFAGKVDLTLSKSQLRWLKENDVKFIDEWSNEPLEIKSFS